MRFLRVMVVLGFMVPWAQAGAGGAVHCPEGTLVGDKCRVYTLKELGLSGPPSSYQFENYSYDTHLSFPSSIDRKSCANGRSDGVNCIIATAAEMGLKDPSFPYKWDEGSGKLWREATYDGGCPIEGVREDGKCVVAKKRLEGYESFRGYILGQKMDARNHVTGKTWYDPKYKALYQNPGAYVCKEGHLLGNRSADRCYASVRLRDKPENYRYDNARGEITHKPTPGEAPVAVKIRCAANTDGSLRGFPDCVAPSVMTKAASIGCVVTEDPTVQSLQSQYKFDRETTYMFANCYVPERGNCVDQGARMVLLSTIRGNTGINVPLCVCDLSRHGLRACAP